MKNKRKYNNRDSLLQLKQKTIHYKSEIARYEKMIKQYENELIKTNEFDSNQEIARVMINDKKKQIIEEFHNATSFFNFSTILPDMTDEEQELLILGNFIIKNNGNMPLHHPFICIKITPTNSAYLSGKIALKNMELNNELDLNEEQWSYMHKDWKDKVRSDGLHWLKPMHCEQLNPNEALTFSNLNVRIKNKEENTKVIIEGYIFSDELRKGLRSLNNISFQF
ncbi:hypothetical protein QA612_18765 [Evansella sp. AB-P1]|uniref:hypothetical protein n=1 Tax=Evansella sp. AB-P1 TaxID=3037653 RepID=UPI00241C079E|nr:hypothetical protein [Evansella sp. AB-P1]MDG5789505.1 hypothetical protein [Evansella sp. AB-P1]